MGSKSFTAEQARYIKLCLMEGWTPAEVAGQMGCGVEAIRRIKRGETWSSVVVDGEQMMRPPRRSIVRGEGVPGQGKSFMDLGAEASAERMVEWAKKNGYYVEPSVETTATADTEEVSNPHPFRQGAA